MQMTGIMQISRMINWGSCDAIVLRLTCQCCPNLLKIMLFYVYDKKKDLIDLTLIILIVFSCLIIRIQCKIT